MVADSASTSAKALWFQDAIHNVTQGAPTMVDDGNVGALLDVESITILSDLPEHSYQLVNGAFEEVLSILHFITSSCSRAIVFLLRA